MFKRSVILSSLRVSACFNKPVCAKCGEKTYLEAKVSDGHSVKGFHSCMKSSFLKKEKRRVVIKVSTCVFFNHCNQAIKQFAEIYKNSGTNNVEIIIKK